MFCQMTQCMTIVEDYFNFKGYKFLRYNYSILYIYPTIQLQAHLLPLVSNRGTQLMSRIMYQKKFLEYCILASSDQLVMLLLIRGVSFKETI